MEPLDNTATLKESFPKTRAPGLEKAPRWLIRYRRALILTAHLLVFVVAMMAAFLMTHRLSFTSNWLVGQYPFWLGMAMILKISAFGTLGQFRGWWRYVGISDLFGIVKASVGSMVALFIAWGFLQYRGGQTNFLPHSIIIVSPGVFVADGCATILLLGGMRMLVRLYNEKVNSLGGGRRKRFLILGAGDAGESLSRELSRMAVSEYDVIGFIDDDPAKKQIRINGIPVLGNVEQLPTICVERNIDEIAIAMPSASQQELRRVVQICQGAKIRFRTVPSLTDIATGRYRVSQIRDVDINDLLGRESIELDILSIHNFLTDKIVLVTGAGGSIGSEMCRQICQFSPEQLILVEQAENPLFYVERELRKRKSDVDLVPVIADITDKVRVDQIFDYYRPHVVIHAAAHKHVPLMELNPGEAVKNNIVGTRTVADAAHQYRVDHFVMISTDKAVNPTSIMGSTKRVAEIYIQNLDRSSDTDFVTVRFGNVLGSEGSVVPIFKQQIAQGGPVTVTHPDMQRYFMTIPEASQLVLQAAAMGQGGEIFVLDMGDPVKIVDLAKELITLSGFRPNEDIEIVFSGLRPGEKLFEELSIAGEDMQSTRHPKIHIRQKIEVDPHLLQQTLSTLIDIAQTQDREAIVAQIRQLVPEYMGELVR